MIVLCPTVVVRGGSKETLTQKSSLSVLEFQSRLVLSAYYYNHVRSVLLNTTHSLHPTKLPMTSSYCDEEEKIANANGRLLNLKMCAVIAHLGQNSVGKV